MALLIMSVTNHKPQNRVSNAFVHVTLNSINGVSWLYADVSLITLAPMEKNKGKKKG